MEINGGDAGAPTGQAGVRLSSGAARHCTKISDAWMCAPQCTPGGAILQGASASCRGDNVENVILAIFLQR